MESLLVRLRERKLVQWTLAYGAGAWGLLQAVDLLSGTYGWPPLVMRALPLLLLAGLLAVVVLAWYHGEKGAQRVGRLEVLLLACLVPLAGAGILWARHSVAGKAPLIVDLPDPPSLPVPDSANASVAVLPFENLSASRENEYFADGITEEVLTTLANVRSLRVIGHESVMKQYRGTTKSTREIARELRVGSIVRGSVQREGKRVRIRAQLLDASTDRLLWAEQYTRPLGDMFALQSEIAGHIADTLHARLTVDERARMARRPTANMDAYSLLLQGREMTQRPELDLDKGLALLRQALALDPSYADVHVAMAEAFCRRFFRGGDRRWLDSAAVAAQEAIRLDSASAEAYRWLGVAIQDAGEGREAALQAQLRAVELNPGNSAGLATLYQFEFGRLDLAARWWELALQHEPTYAQMLVLAGRDYLQLRMPQRAWRLLERSLALGTPDVSQVYTNLIQTYLLEGRKADALAAFRHLQTVSGGGGMRLLDMGQAAAALGDLATARRYLEAGSSPEPFFVPAAKLTLAWILARSGEPARAQAVTREAAALLARRTGGTSKRPEALVDLARLRVVEGRRAEAIDLMEIAVQHGWRLVYEHVGDPVLEALRGDARYDRLIAQVTADVDRQRARVEREGW